MSNCNSEQRENQSRTYTSRVIVGHTLSCTHVVVVVEDEQMKRVMAEIDIEQAAILARDLGRLVRNLRRRPTRAEGKA